MVWLQKLWRISQGFRTTQRSCCALAPCLDRPSRQTPASRATYRTCGCCPLLLLLLALMRFRSQQDSHWGPWMAPSRTTWSLLAAQTAVPHLLSGKDKMDCILGAAHKLTNYSFWPSYSLWQQSRLKGLKNELLEFLSKSHTRLEILIVFLCWLFSLCVATNFLWL